MQHSRKDEILDAFIRLVSRFGFDKTTMQDVAKEVGISVGSIYNDFKNKEELIDAFIKRSGEQFSIACNQIVSQNLPARELLREFMVGSIRIFHHQVRENRGFFEFMNGIELFKYIRKKIDCNRDDFHRHFIGKAQQIMEQGVREGCFQIENVPKTALLFIKAFGGCLKIPFMLEREEQDLLREVVDMFNFLIKAIETRK